MGSLFSGEWTPHYQVSFHSDSNHLMRLPSDRHEAIRRWPVIGLVLFSAFRFASRSSVR